MGLGTWIDMSAPTSAIASADKVVIAEPGLVPAGRASAERPSALRMSAAIWVPDSFE